LLLEADCPIADTLPGMSQTVFAIVVVASVPLGGCTFMHKDFANYEKRYDPIPLNKIRIGTPKIR